MSDESAWHDYRPQLEDSIEANDKATFDRILERAMTGNVKRRGVWLFECNDAGEPYSAFGQTDMAFALLRAARRWGRRDDLDLALDCLGPVLDPGGLTRWQGRGRNRTAWLHARTGVESDVPGGTLNKHLVAALNLANCAVILRELGKGEIADRCRRLAVAAVEQLSSKKWPNLDSFIYRAKGERAVNSWLYYAVKFDGSRDGYWLDFNEKNGLYHLLVMRLFERLHRELGDEVRWKRFRKRGALYHLLRTYRAKMADGGLDRNSTPAKGGRFGRVLEKPGKETDIPKEVVTFFQGFAK